MNIMVIASTLDPLTFKPFDLGHRALFFWCASCGCRAGINNRHARFAAVDAARRCPVCIDCRACTGTVPVTEESCASCRDAMAEDEAEARRLWHPEDYCALPDTDD